MQLLDGLVGAGDVLEPDLQSGKAIRFARDLPKLITFEPPPCTWFIRKIQKPIRSANGSRLISRLLHHDDLALGVVRNALLLQQLTLEGGEVVG